MSVRFFDILTRWEIPHILMKSTIEYDLESTQRNTGCLAHGKHVGLGGYCTQQCGYAAQALDTIYRVLSM